MRNYWLIIVVVALIVIAAFVFAPRSGRKSQADAIHLGTERDQAIAAAQAAYQKAKQAAADLEAGPCLGTVAPDWVADIVHNPRSQVDNLKENQCQEFIDGTVHHFVELDPQGNLIQAF